MRFEPIYKSTEQINSEAESFLQNYHPSLSIPIPIEEIIDLKLQIDIIPVPGLKETSARAGLDIDAFISSDFKSITVDEYVYEKFTNRYRFTLAHEIGHRMLHGYFYTQLHFNMLDEWLSIINQIPEFERKVVEWQANEFAGLVLVPRKVLKNEFKESLEKNKKQIKKIRGDYSDLLIDTTIFTLSYLFQVSEDVIRIRLERDKLIKR